MWEEYEITPNKASEDTIGNHIMYKKYKKSKWLGRNEIKKSWKYKYRFNSRI